MATTTVKLTETSAAGRRQPVRRLTVPYEIAELVVTAGITEFTVELTDDGILYRPVGPGPAEAKVPAWLAK